MKKQKTQIIVLLAILVLIACSYVGLKNYNTKAEEAESEPAYTALSLGEDEKVTNLKVTNENGEFDLKKQDDETWILTSDESVDVDEDKISTKIESIKTITSDQIVENAENLADYGLEEPSVTIEITLENGDSHTIKIGDYNNVASAYYLMVDDISTIYTVPTTINTNFNFDVAAITAAEEETEEDTTEATTESTTEEITEETGEATTESTTEEITEETTEESATEETGE